MVIYEFYIRNCDKHDKLHASLMSEERQKGCCSFNSNGIWAVDGSNPSPLADIGKSWGAITAPLFVLLYLDGFSSFKTTRFHIETSYCWLAPLFEDWI